MTAAQDTSCHFAALRLDGRTTVAPAALQDRVACWLAETGRELEAAGTLPDGAIWLRTFDATVRLEAEGAARLTLHVAERAADDRDAEDGAGQAEGLLLHLTYRLAARLTPERIEWQASGSWIGTQDFMAIACRAAGRIRPARPSTVVRGSRAENRRSRLPALADDALDQRLREAFRMAGEETEARAAEDTPQRRWAAWAFSGAAALLWLPLAPVLLAVNLRHGPDLRLSAQACSLLGLFIALDHAGAYGELAARLPL